MPTASSKFGFLNRFFNGLREANRQQVEAALEALTEADILIGVGAGRVERSLNIPFGEYVRNSDEKKYDNFNDIGYPGDTFDIAAPKFEKNHKKMTTIFASSSGETDETFETLEQAVSCQNEKWKNLLLTQNRNSRICKLAEENNGIVVELKGSDNLDSKNYREFGMQRDVGEYQILWFSQAACQTLKEGKGVDRFYEFVDERIPEVCRKIDEWSESETFNDIIYNLRRHSNAFAAGKKGGKEVAKFFIKRMGQVKQLAGDQAYLLYGGENTPDPRVGDVIFPVSKSAAMQDFYSPVLKGKKSYMLSCCEKAKKAGVIVYPFVGKQNPVLEDICGKENVILIDSAPKGFSDTYARIATQQGIIPIVLAEAYDKKDGIDLSPQNLKNKHGW